MVKVVFGTVLLCLACVQSVRTPSQLPPAREGKPPAWSSPPPAAAPAEARREEREPLVVRPGGYKMADLPVFSKVLFYVRENYYDKNQMVPRRMLLGALEAVQRAVPEIVVEAVPIAAPERVLVTVSGESRTFRIDRVDQPWSLRSTLQQILRFAQARLQPVPEAEEGRRLLDIEMAAVNGMLYTLDPHSVLIDAAAYTNMRGGADMPVGSVGLTVGFDVQRRIRATGIVPSAPAERAGLRAHDRIVRINEEPTAGLTLEDVVARLHGAIGSGLDLYWERDGTHGVQKVHMERARVYAASMDSGPRILTAPAGPGASPAKIGYFHLAHLGADAAGAVESALLELAREHVLGIVVDLRGNSGGLYAQAVRIADAFVKQGTLVSMVGVGARQRKDELARDGGSEPEVPLAVLVDHDTASGAEIIAAALRNLGRAVVLGRHTFGVGTVQVLFDVPSPLAPADGGTSPNKLGLKLTTAQFLTTGDVPIQLTGVAPDIELRDVTVTNVGQRTLFQMEPRPAKRSEATYESPLARSGTLAPPARPVMTLDYLTASPAPDLTDHEVVLGASPTYSGDDFSASFAAELLARLRQPSRASTLAIAKAFVGEIAAREDTRIAAAAAALKADWRVGARTVAPRLVLKIEPTGGTVRAGTVARLRGTVTNVGAAPAFRVRAVLTSDDPTFEGVEMPFGLVSPGQAKTFELAVPIPPIAFARTDLVQACLRDADGDVHAPVAEATVDIEARPLPALSFTCRSIEAAPRGKARPASVRLVMQIRNQGTAAAEQAEATVRRAGEPVHDGVVVRVSRWSGAVAAGAKKEVSFIVDLPSEPGRRPVDLDLTLSDTALPEPVSARVRVNPPPAPGDGAVPDSQWHVTPSSVMATPPLVTVNAPNVASGETVHVSGEVSSETAARDVFIRVWNRTLKRPVRKVFYRNAPVGTARLPFEADVPIWPGSNVITVHARDAQGTQASRTVVVLKRTDDRAPAR